MTDFRNKIYYTVKPVVPRRIALAVRRWRAQRIRSSHAGVWPIDERSGALPPGWAGWPEGKRFALVLTHDVEGIKGLKRAKQLMQLDAKYGFRSAFNFIPEGPYRVSGDILQNTTGAGCEVGVHGLHHDGKLYFSKSIFTSRAAGIRKYLNNWKACGFRSPFMHHHLEWLHELGVEYDSSTFDTDPFEPEPDGAGTIFPFWVPGPGDTGYVELPCTLCPDFTLFVILGEKSIGIWKQKLDWIAERGGLALLDAHPDYMDFDGTGDRTEYPVSLYEDFLRYARGKYGDSCWSALPRDVSRFCAANLRLDRQKVPTAPTGQDADVCGT